MNSSCHLYHSVFLLVLLRIPNPQPNPRIFPSPNPRIFCGRKWRFWVVCLRVNIYLPGGSIQATCVAASAAVWEIKRTSHCRPLPTVCLLLLPAVWSVTSRISQLQVIIWSGRGGGGGGGRPGRLRSGYGGPRLRWRLCIIRCYSFDPV